MFVVRHRCAAAGPGKTPAMSSSSSRQAVAPSALPPRVTHREVRGTYHVTTVAEPEGRAAAREAQPQLVFETLVATPLPPPSRAAAMPKCYGPYLCLAAASMVTGWWSMSRVMDRVDKKKNLRDLERQEAKRRTQQRYKSILTDDKK